ncbi:MAG: DUF4405 domain-containing protein [Thiobacillus sp.]
MMTIQREWVTPIAAGAFLISAVTGVLIFFHVDSGLNKFAHEWLSWVLLGAVALHMAANFSGFRRHLGSHRGQILLGLFVLVLGLSFAGSGANSEPPFAPPIRALSAAPLATLAEVAQLSPEALRERLAEAGIQPVSGEQSLRELTGPDLRRQVQILGLLFAEPK